MISLFEDSIPVNIPGLSVAVRSSNVNGSYVGIKPDNVTARQANDAYNRLKPFMPIRQGKAVAELMRGEEISSSGTRWSSWLNSLIQCRCHIASRTIAIPLLTFITFSAAPIGTSSRKIWTEKSNKPGGSLASMVT